jgi:hypothetical protein
MANNDTKVKPDQQDYTAIERTRGPLPKNATAQEAAERYRLAQANKLIRLYGPPLIL